MTDFGLLKSYLGIQVKQIKGEITLAQSTFALKILHDFNLQDWNSSQTPLEVRQVYSQEDSKNRVDSRCLRIVGFNVKTQHHGRDTFTVSDTNRGHERFREYKDFLP